MWGEARSIILAFSLERWWNEKPGPTEQEFTQLLGYSNARKARVLKTMIRDMTTAEPPLLRKRGEHWEILGAGVTLLFSRLKRSQRFDIISGLLESIGDFLRKERITRHGDQVRIVGRDLAINRKDGSSLSLTDIPTFSARLRELIESRLMEDEKRRLVLFPGPLMRGIRTNRIILRLGRLRLWMFTTPVRRRSDIRFNEGTVTLLRPAKRIASIA